MSLSILQVATGFPGWGGTELHILNLSDQLRRRGHDVTIACRPGKWVEERAQAMGLRTVPMEVSRQQDWHDFPAMRRFLRENKTDVLHVHWSTDIIVPGFAALREHVPVRVLSRHMPYPFKNRVGTWLYSQLLFSRIVTVSRSVRETLVGCGVSPDKVEVIYHGTDVEVFARTEYPQAEARRRLGIPDGHLGVGIVGRIAPEKGHKFLLDAALALGDRYPLRFVVIGNGPDEAALRQSAQDMGLAGKVIFTGFMDDVNNAMHGLDMVVVPSTWDEPCSAVVQQAMALSKPVIGTQVGGTPEMVQEGLTGLLVPPSNAAALADAIAALAGDAFGRRRMGEAGRERVLSLFSLDVMTDRIEELYCREYSAKHGTGTLHKVLAS